MNLARRAFMKCTGAAAGAMALGWPRSAAAADLSNPNVVVILVDTMVFWAMRCAGYSAIHTPNLDRLAAGGMLFENAYACTPQCSPCRSQIMTGNYASKTRFRTNGQCLPALLRETSCRGTGHEHGSVADTLGSVFHEAGYRTGYIGKWHLNGNGTRRTRGTLALTPEVRECGYVESANQNEESGFIPSDNRLGWDHWTAGEWRGHYFSGFYWKDDGQGGGTQVTFDGYKPDVHTDLAIDYINGRHDEWRGVADKPFFLTVSYGPPHGPFIAPPAFDIYSQEIVRLRPNVDVSNIAVGTKGKGCLSVEALKMQMAQYLGQITSLDACVGRIMARLEDLGLTESTIVCFMSDHGEMFRSHGEIRKGQPYEESCHVPLIMRWPGRAGSPKIPAGAKSDMLVGSVDLLPTLVGLAGLRCPTVHGCDLSSHVLADDGGPVRLHLDEGDDNNDSLYIVRDSGTDHIWRGVVTKKWKYIVRRTARGSGAPWLLYDLENDPYEQRNRVDSADQDVVSAKRILADKLAAWEAAVGEADIDDVAFFK